MRELPWALGEIVGLKRTLIVRSTAIASLLLLGSSVVSAQHIYVDANGDGVHSLEDVVDPKGLQVVDIWIQTDVCADGSPAGTALERSKLTINSYEFILVAEGGSVEFVSYTNLQPSMVVPIATAKSANEFHTGYAGPEILPPGKYRLGRLSYRVTGGQPSLRFAATSALDPRAGTSFGSKSSGLDGDNTLKLSAVSGAAANGIGSEVLHGDWVDSNGLRAESRDISRTGPFSKTDASRFAVSFAVDRTKHMMSLRVNTTMPGSIRALVFDVRGRLVRDLHGDSELAGTHDIRLNSGKHRLPAGVYFYSVRAPEGQLTGRFIVVK